MSAVLWLAASAAAIVFVTRLIAQRFDLAPVATFVVLWVPFALIVFPYGEHAALALGALALIAHGVRRDRPVEVAIGLGAFAVLPHVFIPLVAALAVCLPRQRRTVGLTVAVLALTDVALRGPSDALRYLTAVLPAHALAEIDGTNQYGVAWILHAVGIDAGSSLALTRVIYAVGVALAAGAASRVRRATQCDEAVVFVPVLLAVTFSPFVHYAEIALALPAAVLVARSARGRDAGIATACFAALALPWESVVAHPGLTAVFAGTAACCVLAVRGRAPQAMRFALGASLVAAVLVIVAHGGPALRRASMARQHSELAQASWSRYVAAHRSSDAPVWWALKAPTWIALLGLALCGARLRANEQDEAPVLVRNAPLRLKGESFG